ncbi:MAG: ABC transporter substrate-binding protein [Actinobacteria bacterium]|nr:ABC transporter substrate-binding protein [Actinomycetota bacterium]
MRRPIVGASVGAVVAGALLLAGCSSSSSSGSSGSGSSSSGSGSSGTSSSAVTVRLGLLANITHAPALIALQKGYFTKDLGKNKLTSTVYNTGTLETTAILAGQLDVAYVGPNPAINAFQKSGGTAIKIISGVATGGASVVVKPSVTSAAGLKGKTVDTPSLGNTQDVAIRYYLKQNGLNTTTTGGGDVTIKPTTPNSNAVLQFQSGQIAGASEPSPYDVEMVKDGGKVLFAEPGVTTIMVVTQTFLKAHPDVVNDLLKANIQAEDYIKSSPSDAQTAANAELTTLSGKGIKSSILPDAFKEITFTNDPDASSLSTDATQAKAVGLLTSTNLNGIFDLTPLNTLLKTAGEPQVNP